jgi:hypothetical protein
MRTYFERWKREYDEFRAERTREAERQFEPSDTETFSHDGPLSHSLLAQPVYEGRFTHGLTLTQIMLTWIGHGLSAIDQYLRL